MTIGYRVGLSPKTNPPRASRDETDHLVKWAELVVGFGMAKPSKNPSARSNSAVLGRSAFAAISAVEGLKLSPAGRERLKGPKSPDQRRAEVLRAYTDIKGGK
jgi:hypothetical protein